MFYPRVAESYWLSCNLLLPGNIFQYLCIFWSFWVLYKLNFAGFFWLPHNAFVPIRCWQGRSRCRSMDLPAAILIQSSVNPTKRWSKSPLKHYAPLPPLFPTTIFYCSHHSSSSCSEPEENENPSKPSNAAWLILLRKGEILYLNNGLFQ